MKTLDFCLNDNIIKFNIIMYFQILSSNSSIIGYNECSLIFILSDEVILIDGVC